MSKQSQNTVKHMHNDSVKAVPIISSDFRKNIQIARVQFQNDIFEIAICLRPYHVESTSSRLILQVCKARLVIGSETAWEHRMSLAFPFRCCNLFGDDP